jgi:hypothetical protein
MASLPSAFAFAQTPTFQYPAYNHSGSAPSLVKAVALDSDGNTLAVGNRRDTLDFGAQHMINTGGAFLVKLDPFGNEIWSKTGGASSSFQSDQGTDVAADASGNVYFAGVLAAESFFDGVPLPLGSTGFVAKYNSAGVLQWVQGISGNVYALAVDGNGGVFINVQDASIRKLDPTNGSELVFVSVAGNLINGGYHNIEIDGSGNLLVQLGNKITKFNTALEEQWSTPVDLPFGLSESYRLSVDPSGNVLATFYSLGGTAILGGASYSNFPNGYIYSLDGATGAVASVDLFSADGSANKPKHAIRDAAGNMYVNADLAFNSPHILKVDPSLAVVWNKPCADIQDMVRIADDCLLLGGRYSTTTTLDTYTLPRPNNSGQDNAYAVRVCAGNVGVEELQAPLALEVYPNPSSDRIKVNNAAQGLLRVITASGSVAMSVDQRTGTVSIDISELPIGIYVVRDADGDAVRFVVSR